MVCGDVATAPVRRVVAGPRDHDRSRLRDRGGEALVGRGVVGRAARAARQQHVGGDPGVEIGGAAVADRLTRFARHRVDRPLPLLADGRDEEQLGELPLDAHGQVRQPTARPEALSHHGDGPHIVLLGDGILEVVQVAEREQVVHQDAGS
jgi:hypothetical protein